MPDFRPSFLQGLALGSAFRLALPREAMRGLGGARAGAAAGSSLDFLDFREYHPGDDLRRLDWSVYARTDREVVKLYREEVFPRLDVVLDAKTPWICAQCAVCSSRCPQNVDICSTMRAVRLASKHAGKRPVPEADIFDDEFIANVKSHGVSNEQYLAAAYNIKSGHFMQDAGNATRMLKRRMVGVAIHNTQGRAEVAALVDRALAADAARRASDAAEGGEA